MHSYTYHVIRNRYYIDHSTFKLMLIIVAIIIDVKNKELLLHSITLTGISIIKVKGDK